MKSFIISLAVVISIFLLTIFNSIYINEAIDELTVSASKLTPTESSINQLISQWDKVGFAIRLSSSHKETHRIDEALEVLLAKVKSDTVAGFYEERALLIEYLHQIKEDESVSFESII